MADFDGQARAFWRFSLNAYRRPGVAALCLELQDRAGRDVNMLLLCLWAGARLGLELEARDLEILAVAIGPWNRQMLGPLRALRRSLDHDPAQCQLRQRLLAAELAAEREAQRLLVRHLPVHQRGTPDLDQAGRNLERYAGAEAAVSLCARFVRGGASRPTG